MNGISLIPSSYGELIAEKHLVRTVNEAVEKIDLTALLKRYKGEERAATTWVSVFTSGLEIPRV
ncbi:MAG: hypothetical protein LLG42_06140 [Chloroflexi bacterium]|nr:hypothetical protein [Chloroflexota bacterium]